MNFRKFNGREKNLSSWFRQPETGRKHPITVLKMMRQQFRQPSQTLTGTSLTAQQSGLPGMSLLLSVRTMAIFRSYIRREFVSVLSEMFLLSLWADLRLTSDTMVAYFIGTQNRYTRKENSALAKVNFLTRVVIFPVMQ